jgi:nucleotide-binding universal stress UspA family protein
LPGGHLLPVPDRHWAQAAQDATLRAFVDGVLLDLRLVDDGLPGPVSVETRAVPGDPVDVLVRESAGAAGLVVGHYEEAGPLTSVAAGCARRARCPVIVVPLGSSGDEAGPMARGRCAREGVASPGGRPGPGRREAPRRRP